MHFFEDFKEDLSYVFQHCRKRINEYPPIFQSEGINFLDKYDVLKKESNKNYICYLLPFWLKDSLGIENEIAKKISIANTFLMLYFLIQDDIIDQPACKNKGTLLPLGNLFMLDFMHCYHELFPAGSPFWTYLQEYTYIWSKSMLWENTDVDSTQTAFTSEDLNIMAYKAAPLKVAAVAACLLGDKKELIKPISDTVDLILTSLQVVDDWIDWQEDLISGNRNYILSGVLSKKGIHSYSMLNEADVKRTLFFSDVLVDLFSIIDSNHLKISDLGKDAFPYLISFHKSFLDYSSKLNIELNEDRNVLVNGGLNYYMYNYHKKKEHT
ncbi:class 1 isoprenoid biosynthesis enzyme [Acetivibrio cellulolyticus]|uniref:class 1 isoprenoid biosynthesis enzyme n=1 Tax=Acetivibrio cellulolyticus TaxID=35830 RepID=UPI0001E2F667|nr:class 1 isoprenoid biosynthesis enzyme [Acetivibrio cellulolyticus]